MTTSRQLTRALSDSSPSVNMLLARRFGALVVRDGAIRRSGKVVDQVVALALLITALVMLVLIALLIAADHRVNLLAGWLMEGGLSLSILLVVHAALVPQQTAAKVERFLAVRDGGESD